MSTTEHRVIDNLAKHIHKLTAKTDLLDDVMAIQSRKIETLTASREVMSSELVKVLGMLEQLKFDREDMMKRNRSLEAENRTLTVRLHEAKQRPWWQR